MNEFLVTFKSLIDSLGATVVLPIFIFIVALIFGCKVGKAFQAAITIGIAFVGINLVIGLMWGTLSNLGQAMVTNTGVTRDIIDVGWPTSASIAFASDMGFFVIPLTILVNILLISLKLTKTMNIDLWNFWQFAFIGAVVSIITKNFWFGLLAAALASALALFLADWTAKAIQEVYSLPGISISHLFTTSGVIFGIAINWVIDRIPGLRDIDVNPEKIEKRFGAFGDPVVLGLFIGVVLGILGYYNAGDFKTVLVKVLNSGISLAAVMLLLPTMVKILMKGLIPVSEAARDFMQKHHSQRELYIGLDSAALVGHPAALSSSLVLVPLAILLSVFLPGNRVLIFADLATIPFVTSIFTPVMRTNVFRMIIAGFVMLAAGFLFATSTAATYTAAAIQSGFTVPEGASQVSAMGIGFIWPQWMFVKFTEWMGPIGLLVIVVLLGIAMFLFSKNTRAWEIAAGATKEE
jgi:PTS system galactitol-specific IIC component